MDNERQLIPGKLYKIVMDDCCIQGEFVARFLRYDQDSDLYHFDNRVSIGPSEGQWTAELRAFQLSWD